MSTPTDLYPSIPQVETFVLSGRLEEIYALACEGTSDPVISASLCEGIAHHARRAAELERRLAEAEQAAGLAKALERFDEALKDNRLQLMGDRYGWCLYDFEGDDSCQCFSTIPTADLARVLGAWLDQQEGKQGG